MPLPLILLDAETAQRMRTSVPNVAETKRQMISYSQEKVLKERAEKEAPRFIAALKHKHRDYFFDEEQRWMAIGWAKEETVKEIRLELKRQLWAFWQHFNRVAQNDPIEFAFSKMAAGIVDGEQWMKSWPVMMEDLGEDDQELEEELKREEMERMERSRSKRRMKVFSRSTQTCPSYTSDAQNLQQNICVKCSCQMDCPSFKEQDVDDQVELVDLETQETEGGDDEDAVHQHSAAIRNNFSDFDFELEDPENENKTDEESDDSSENSDQNENFNDNLAQEENILHQNLPPSTSQSALEFFPPPPSPSSDQQSLLSTLPSPSSSTDTAEESEGENHYWTEESENSENGQREARQETEVGKKKFTFASPAAQTTSISSNLTSTSNLQFTFASTATATVSIDPPTDQHQQTSTSRSPSLSQSSPNLAYYSRSSNSVDDRSDNDDESTITENTNMTATSNGSHSFTASNSSGNPAPAPVPPPPLPPPPQSTLQPPLTLPTVTTVVTDSLRPIENSTPTKTETGFGLLFQLRNTLKQKYSEQPQQPQKRQFKRWTNPNLAKRCLHRGGNANPIQSFKTACSTPSAYITTTIEPSRPTTHSATANSVQSPPSTTSSASSSFITRTNPPPATTTANPVQPAPNTSYLTTITLFDPQPSTSVQQSTKQSTHIDDVGGDSSGTPVDGTVRQSDQLITAAAAADQQQQPQQRQQLFVKRLSAAQPPPSNGVVKCEDDDVDDDNQTTNNSNVSTASLLPLPRNSDDSSISPPPFLQSPNAVSQKRKANDSYHLPIRQDLDSRLENSDEGEDETGPKFEQQPQPQPQTEPEAKTKKSCLEPKKSSSKSQATLTHRFGQHLQLRSLSYCPETFCGTVLPTEEMEVHMQTEHGQGRCIHLNTDFPSSWISKFR